MLNIRSEQWSVLRDDELVDYVELALPLLHEHWPNLQLIHSDEDLRGRIRAHARGAAALGLDQQGHWLRYLNVAVALGDDFAAHPEARRILRDRRPPAIRLDMLTRWAQTSLRSR